MLLDNVIRIFILLFLVLGVFFFAKNFFKKRSISQKLVCALFVVFYITIIVLSFLTFDIPKPEINTNIMSVVDKISKEQIVCDDKITNYSFYCESYYGEISFSKINEQEEKKLKTTPSFITFQFNDGDAECYGSYVDCTRDLFFHPYKATGIIRIYCNDLFIAVKYQYKNSKSIPIIKHLTFSEYFYMEEIVLSDIFKSIDKESVTVVDKSDVWS